MKWAKSRKVKNSRSASRSDGTPAAGWRAASSETIRRDADPTWWTCSSALGRPAMKDWRLTPRSVPEGTSAARADHRLRDLGHGLGLDRLAVDEDRRRGVDAGLGGGVARGVDPALERHVLDAGTDVGLGRAGLDGPLDQLVAVGERALLGRLVVEEQVVEGLGDLGTRLVEHHGERVGCLRRVVADPLEERERAVLDVDVARLDGGVELVADGLLELAAERAEEVLVDDDRLRGVGVADDHAVVAGRAGRRGVRLVGAEVADEEVAADDQEQHGTDQAEAGELLLALGLLAALLGLRPGTLGPGPPGLPLGRGRRLLVSGPVRGLLLRHRGFFLRGRRDGRRSVRWTVRGRWGTARCRARAATPGVRRAT